MPNRVVKVVKVRVPSGERVPPLVLHRLTTGRTRRSAALLVLDRAGSETKVNNSGRYC